jgi:hypothetical protein
MNRRMAGAKTKAYGQMYGWNNVVVFDSCIYSLSNSGFDSRINEKSIVNELALISC